MRRIHFLVVLLFLSQVTPAQQKLRTENVVLITLDGMRWQEVFTGADSSYMMQQKVYKDPGLMKKYWHPDPIVRRSMLMPFLWSVWSSQGQLFGNRLHYNHVNVSNNQWFSYPGYSEILTGTADNDRIHSNDKFYNPNVTVLEFINRRPEFRGRVAAFTSWDVFPFIINDKRSGVMVNAGQQPATAEPLSAEESMLNALMPAVPNTLGDVRLDAFTFSYGMEYMKKNKPRVIYFGFDETDDFAHAGEYAAYLNSAHATDRFLAMLYEYVQSDPFYRDKTTFIITVDHGRGPDTESWKHHGAKVAGADQIWAGFLGPDTPAQGELKAPAQLYQNQIASTLAAFLGLTFENKPAPGAAITGVKR
jgi:hypothetical protein